MSKTMWFGTVKHAQLVPVPKSGMTRTMEGTSNEFALDNGGIWIDDTGAYHLLYGMEFPIANKNYQGIEAFSRFQNGEWGTEERNGRDGYLRFVDPMHADENLLNPVWASPSIAEKSDWKSIADVTPTYEDSGANSYFQPLRRAVFDTSTYPINYVPTKPNSVFTLLIPPTHKVWLGWSGSLTGGARMRIQLIKLDGSLETVQDLAGIADTAQPTLTYNFSGATYKAVKIYISSAVALGAGTIKITSMRAQILPIAQTPTAIDRHIPGYGHSGLKFRGSSRTDTYVQAAGRKLISASLVLAEVEPWGR